MLPCAYKDNRSWTPKLLNGSNSSKSKEKIQIHKMAKRFKTFSVGARARRVVSRQMGNMVRSATNGRMKTLMITKTMETKMRSAMGGSGTTKITSMTLATMTGGGLTRSRAPTTVTLRMKTRNTRRKERMEINSLDTMMSKSITVVMKARTQTQTATIWVYINRAV